MADTSMLRGSAISACMIPDVNGSIPARYEPFRIYFQDFAGKIRETRYTDENDSYYTGGDASSIISVIEDAKDHTPLAAAAYALPDKGVIAILLFYISKDNYMRMATWDSKSQTWKAEPEGSKAGRSLHLESKLACAVDQSKSQVRLFAQLPDRLVHGFVSPLPALEGTPSWSPTLLKENSYAGTGLAASRLDVIFVTPDDELKLFSSADGFSWKDSGITEIPDAKMDVPPAGSLGLVSGSAIAPYLIYYSGLPEIGVAEGGTTKNYWNATRPLSPRLLEEESGLAIISWHRGGNDLQQRLFFQSPEGGLKGFNYQGQRWQYEHPVPSGSSGK